MCRSGLKCVCMAQHILPYYNKAMRFFLCSHLSQYGQHTTDRRNSTIRTNILLTSRSIYTSSYQYMQKEEASNIYSICTQLKFGWFSEFLGTVPSWVRVPYTTISPLLYRILVECPTNTSYVGRWGRMEPERETQQLARAIPGQLFFNHGKLTGNSVKTEL